MASGHRAHAASWRRRGHRLGHLGHLGHGFLFVSWRQHGHALGHLGHGFLHDLNDLNAKIWRPGNSPALGHLGHWVIVLKLAPVDPSTCVDTPYRY
jgi:hypothetical protein